MSDKKKVKTLRRSKEEDEIRKGSDETDIAPHSNLVQRNLDGELSRTGAAGSVDIASQILGTDQPPDTPSSKGSTDFKHD